MHRGLAYHIMFLGVIICLDYHVLFYLVVMILGIGLALECFGLGSVLISHRGGGVEVLISCN